MISFVSNISSYRALIIFFTNFSKVVIYFLSNYLSNYASIILLSFSYPLISPTRSFLHIVMAFLKSLNFYCSCLVFSATGLCIQIV
jgi:hypothetical protein